VIVVHTEIPVDPAHRAELLALTEELVEHAADEPGTVRYRASTGVTDSDTLRFFEQYADTAAAEQHQSSEIYRRFNEVLPGLVDGEIETVQFEVDETDVATATFSAEEAAAAVRDADQSTTDE
jgi:quinol monooxygenase YgiN